ncbi:MAG TPA: hypothetical protein VJ111_06490 [Chitinophagaceae bacterium]|nr:hypothetical protein [Chitinophagaceae bacterium]
MFNLPVKTFPSPPSHCEQSEARRGEAVSPTERIAIDSTDTVILVELK